MLSAFTARPLLELRQRDKSKIESVLLQGDRLFAGLSTGALRVYRVNDNAAPEQVAPQPVGAEELSSSQKKEEKTSRPSTANAKPTELLREQEKFSRYAITQLAMIKEANLLVSLSSSQVSFHDLSDYELQETLTKTKGATTFAVTSHIVEDETTQIPEIVSCLAVAVKKKLFLWEWRDSTLSTSDREFTLPANVRSITWISGEKLVLGLTSHFVILDIETSKIIDITGPGAIGGSSSQESSRFGGVGVSSLMGGLGPLPVATRLVEGEVLLAKDINSHFIDTDGKALGRRQVPWGQAPDMIGYSYPYLLALYSSKGALEVRNPQTLTSLQSVSVPNAKMLFVPTPGVSLAHAGKGFVVAGDRTVWRMDALGYDAQIDALVESGAWDEALSLLSILEDALLKNKDDRMREVKMLKAEDLFEQKKHRISLELFTDVQAAPNRVIRLFPSTISGDSLTFDSPPAPDVGDEDSKGGKSAEDNMKGSVEEVRAAQQKAETSSIVGSIRNSLRNSIILPKEDKETLLNDKELKNAVVELISFLVDTRTRIQRVLNFDGSLKDADKYDELTAENKALIRRLDDHSEESDSEETSDDLKLDELRQTAKLVDSTLFRCYMFARPQLAGPLFRLPNFIDARVAEEKLLESKRYADLVDFFYGKGLHERALELLTVLGKGEMEGEEIPESLRGTQRIVTYLQSLSGSSIDLILRFVDWPMRTDPEHAMEVFIGAGSNAESLPRKQVLEYLKSVNSVRAAEYLEFVIDEFNEKSADIHHHLIEIYLQSISSLQAAQESKLGQQQKLLSFIRASHYYEPWRVVPMLRKEEPLLHEARAIVLGRMGQHKQALQIYVFDMEDIEKAEEYCNEAWLEEQHPTVPKSPSISRPTSRRAMSPSSPTMENENDKPTPYLLLLSLLLSPHKPRKPQLGPALDLLARHGARLPAASTLDLIPEHISVHDVEAYFMARMRASASTFNKARITAGLRKTVDDNADAALRLGNEMPEGVQGAGKGRNKSFIVYEDSICKVCRKRFGGSVVKVLPGGEEVVHYGCASR